MYYEDAIHGVLQARETREVWGYYSIYSLHTSWINFGCVSLGKIHFGIVSDFLLLSKSIHQM